ncbi:phage tail tube protein [Marinovum sp. SP66]|uniref:phage tail tube protein n=1 Tax=Marinovum TaxID=367771 RepID=UPI00237C4FC7|nr:phage tail tube protein [Marinovum sp. SP66]MDD9738428.1 phage tail tube protein [Marinovum sp. SP66]
MPNARGDQAKLLVRRQAAFGAAEAALDGAFYKLPFYSYNVSPSGELANDEAIYGDDFPGEVVAGLRNLAGTFEVPMGFDSIGWHLAQLLGLPTTTGLGPYVHSFTAAALPSILLASHGISHAGVGQHFTQDSLATTGMEINAQKNGTRQRVTFNAAGREEVKAGATLDSTPVEYAVDPVPVGFQGALSLDGSEVAGVTSVGLTLNTGREPDQESLNGAATASEISDGVWGLNGTIGARFRDAQLYDLADVGTAFALTLAWQISANYSLSIAVPSLQLERSGVPINGRGLISQDFNWRTNRPAAGAELIEITLTNATAAYANAS